MKHVLTVNKTTIERIQMSDNTNERDIFTELDEETRLRFLSVMGFNTEGMSQADQRAALDLFDGAAVDEARAHNFI